jgi:hypothetical protein
MPIELRNVCGSEVSEIAVKEPQTVSGKGQDY